MSNLGSGETNKDFLITEVRHAGEDWSAVNSDTPASYTNEFRCVPRSVPYRPEIKAPPPHIPGMQTASDVSSLLGNYRDRPPWRHWC